MFNIKELISISIIIVTDIVKIRITIQSFDFYICK